MALIGLSLGVVVSLLLQETAPRRVAVRSAVTPRNAA